MKNSGVFCYFGKHSHDWMLSSMLNAVCMLVNYEADSIPEGWVNLKTIILSTRMSQI